MDYKEILDRIAAEYRKILKDNLAGIYVHGSIAFGCFHPERSDIDFLVVIKEPTSLQKKQQLMRILLDLDDSVPPKGLEMSVVLEQYCRDFVYPTPFELHFSNSHKDRCKSNLEQYCMEMHGTDKDLAAHFTVVKAVGYSLDGEEIDNIFGEVPKADYLDSILLDIENAAEEVFENPVYIILNLCRVYAFMKDGLVLSKAQGGMWGMQNLPPAYKPVVEAALADYSSGKGFVGQDGQIGEFVSYMMRQIKKHKDGREVAICLDSQRNMEK